MLITVQQAREFCNGKPESDAVFATLAKGVSDAVESYMSVNVLAKDYAQKFNGAGKTKLFLTNRPVNSVASLTINGRPIPPSTGDGVAGYVADSNQIYLTGYTFEKGVQNVHVSYNAGLATVPYDLEMACLKWVSFLYKEMPREGQSSKTLAGETVTYTVTDLPASVRAILDAYRNRIPA
jgi:hypothetical protein